MDYGEQSLKILSSAYKTKLFIDELMLFVAEKQLN